MSHSASPSLPRQHTSRPRQPRQAARSSRIGWRGLAHAVRLSKLLTAADILYLFVVKPEHGPTNLALQA